MRVTRAGVAAVAAAASLASPLTAVAAAPTVPQQGVAIFVDNTGSCTLGYNDVARGVSYTAGHCGTPGARVRLLNRATHEVSVPMGTFYPSPGYDGNYSNDWGEVRWDPGVKLPTNRFSGEKILARSEVKRGDTVCSHGEATHTNSDKYTCGTFHGWVNESFTANIEGWQKGDSGGPVWVPGRGLVGIASAGSVDPKVSVTVKLGPVRKDGAPVGWGAAPREGDPISQQEFFNAYVYAAGFGDGWVTYDPNDSGASGTTGGTITIPGTIPGTNRTEPTALPAATPPARATQSTPAPAPSAPAPVQAKPNASAAAPTPQQRNREGMSPVVIVLIVVSLAAAAAGIPVLLKAMEDIG